MNRLGVIVDLSHVAKRTMIDILRLSKAPVVFSHSSAFRLCNHYRNVQDDVLVMTVNGSIHRQLITKQQRLMLTPSHHTHSTQGENNNNKNSCQYIMSVFKLVSIVFVNTANLLRMKTKINIVVELSSVDKIDTRWFLFNQAFWCATKSTFLLNDSK